MVSLSYFFKFDLRFTHSNDVQSFVFAQGKAAATMHLSTKDGKKVNPLMLRPQAVQGSPRLALHNTPQLQPDPFALFCQVLE
jgi:hypothetical protein